MLCQSIGDLDDWSCLDDSSDECWSEDADDYPSSLNGGIKGIVAGQTLSQSEDDQKPGKGKILILCLPSLSMTRKHFNTLFRVDILSFERIV